MSERDPLAALSPDERRAMLVERLRSHASAPQVCPLSFAQEAFWLAAQLAPEAGVGNMSAAVWIPGHFEAAVAERVLAELVRRHEALRTSVVTVGGEPAQVIAATGRAAVQWEELGEGAAAARAVEDLAAAEARRPFDLTQGPLIRVRGLRIGSQWTVLVVTIHHIVCDGWSLRLLVRECAMLVDAFERGAGSPLPEPGLRYRDHVLTQRERLTSGALDGSIEYWRKQLRGNVPALSGSRRRPVVAEPRMGTVRVTVGAPVRRALEEVGRRTGATLFMTLLAAFQGLLARWTGQDDVRVGTPVAGREGAETEGVVGCFINTLVLRTDVSGNPTFEELVRRVRQVCLEAYEHQEVPYGRLVRELSPSVPSNLYQAMLSVRIGVAMPGVRFVAVDPDAITEELCLALADEGDALAGVLRYSEEIYEATTAERLAEQFVRFLEGVVAEPGRRLGDVPLLEMRERERLLEDFAGASAQWEGPKTVGGLFDAQADRTPTAVAVQDERRALTYAELRGEANRLARHLRGLGVGPDVRVGVHVERSVELLVGLLGIVKAGGAFVPLEPGQPVERLAGMAAEAGIGVVLSQWELAEGACRLASRVVWVDRDMAWHGESAADLPDEAEPETLAFVIYTSGSTGSPKGVMVTHGNLRNHLRWRQDAFRLGPDDRMLQKTSLAFDASVAEIFWPLTAGARLVLARPGGHRDPAYLVRTIVEEAITIVNFVPSMLDLFLREADVGRCAGVRHVMCGGEPLPLGMQERVWARLPARLHNMYGPTETTVASASWTCQPDRPTAPIGRPIANTQIHLLDARLELVPIGATGEVCIGGAGVARGYLGRPDLTAERFVPDPFGRIAGARLYRTGDLARYDADGVLEFVGRADRQVKIRGVRVEPGEIEAVLAGHPGVRHVAVAGRVDASGSRHLVAYVVPVSSPGPGGSALRNFLKGRLPSSMVPSIFVELAALPLLSNGKIDFRALPEPTGADLASLAPYAPPRTELERTVADIWAATLGVERVGIHDNFFERGGHSLLAAQAVSRLRDRLGVDVTVRGIFEASTVAELAPRVEAILAAGPLPEGPPLTLGPRAGDAPLSFAQQRMWFLDQVEPGSAKYTIAGGVRLRGPLVLAALEGALNDVVLRHEALRTTFPSVDGTPVQRIAPELTLTLPVEDLSDLPDAEREAALRRRVAAEARRPFALPSGPLIRGSVLRLSAEEHVVLLALHHIVADGQSTAVLAAEMSARYAARVSGRVAPLPDLPIQYQDFAAWQRQRLDAPVARAQIDYWRKVLEGPLPRLELPTDHPVSAGRPRGGGREMRALSLELTRAVKQMSARLGATVFVAAVAALGAVLSRASGQTDIVLSTAMANRNRTEVEPLIGQITNPLLLRLDLTGDPTVTEWLSRVRDVAVGAYANQDVPIEWLVVEIDGLLDFFSSAPVLRDTGAGEGASETAARLLEVGQAVYGGEHPVDRLVARLGSTADGRPDGRPRVPVQAAVVALSPLATRVEVPGLSWSIVDPDADRDDMLAEAELTLLLRDDPDGLVLMLSHSFALFEPSTARRMLDEVVARLEGFIADPGRRLSAPA